MGTHPSLRSVLPAMTFALLLPSCAAEMPATTAPQACEKGHHDVIIVGAGIAGITAAKALRDQHLDVIVLEATKRIGGRGITTETLGEGTFSAPIDLGGAWIHGVKTNPLTPVILGMGYATQRTHVTAADHLFYSNKFADKDERDQFEHAYDAFEKSIEEAFGKEGDQGKDKDGRFVSAATYLSQAPVQNLDPVRRRLLALNAGPLEGATELEKSSLEDANDFISDDDDFLRRGYGTFVEQLGEEIRPLVRLGTPVTKITRLEGGGVTVTTDKQEVFEASKVLVTVSTGVLARGKIAFEPALPPEKLQAIQGLPMGLLNKVILELTTPDVFPKDERGSLANTWVLYGGDDPAGKEDMAFVFQPLDTNIAVGFFGGQRAWDLEKEQDHGKATMVALAVKAMTDMCLHSSPPRTADKCDVKGALKTSAITAWGANEQTFGAYSAALPGMASKREELAKPVANTVYFAGEACFNATYNGSFAGAYSSALRAAHGIADCLSHEKRREKCVWQPISTSPPKKP